MAIRVQVQELEPGLGPIEGDPQAPSERRSAQPDLGAGRKQAPQLARREDANIADGLELEQVRRLILVLETDPKITDRCTAAATREVVDDQGSPV